MKKNVWIIAFAIVSLLLAGTIGYIIAENVVSKKYENSNTSKDDVDNEDDNQDNVDVDNVDNEDDNQGNVDVEKEEITELSLNDSLVTSLVYPKSRTGLGMLGYKDSWDYKNETIDTLGRSRMMLDAANGVNYSQDDNSNHIYSAVLIKNNFIKIYGPDVDYYDGDVEGGSKSCEISKYDSEKNVYIAYTGCGGANGGQFKDSVSKKYKAEQSGDYIHIYEYVQSAEAIRENEKDWDSPLIIYLLDKNYNRTTLLNGVNESNYESVIYQMMDEGKVDTYKWTFKKQSDGKYYFYSGNWED